MVKKATPLSNYAFTMIELIFAIVIIAISVISLPTMIQSSNKNIDGSILQEAIFAAEAVLNESTSFYWDSNSQNDKNLTTDNLSRVINTGDCNGATAPYTRVGHINRQCLSDNTTGVNYVGDSTSVEWAESLYSTDTLLLEGASTSGGAATYKSGYIITAYVDYCGTSGSCVQFGNETNNPNLKQIQVEIKDPDTYDILVRLRAYTANIGDVKIERKML